MARVKAEDKPVWAKPEFLKTPGLGVKLVPVTRTEKGETVEGFKASPDGKAENQVILQATTREVSFGGNLQTAVAAFGSVEGVLNVVEDFINSQYEIQAKNAAKSAAFGEERQILKAIDDRIAAFIQKRGVEPTDEQRDKIAAMVRATFELATL